jgi:hypothetical protein
VTRAESVALLEGAGLAPPERWSDEQLGLAARALLGMPVGDVLEHAVNLDDLTVLSKSWRACVWRYVVDRFREPGVRLPYRVVGPRREIQVDLASAVAWAALRALSPPVTGPRRTRRVVP